MDYLGIVFYLSMWYKRNERQFRVALFFSAASLAGAFGGILAFGIAKMKGVGGYSGWRWIFILVWRYNLKPRCQPADSIYRKVFSQRSFPWQHTFSSTTIPTPPTSYSTNERQYIQERLKLDSDATEDEKLDWNNVMKAFTDIKVYLYAFGFHTLSLPLYTLSLFLPSIIKGLGYKSATAQLITIPPYAIAFCLTVAFAILSEKFRVRTPLVLASSCLAIIGYILLLSDPRPGISYVGIIFAAAGIYPSVALILSWPANNVSGQTKRAVSNAMQIMIGNCGAVIGTQLYRTETAPRYFLGHSFALGYMVANLVIVSILYLVLKKENEKRDAASIANADID